jgi:hypothetical protein
MAGTSPFTFSRLLRDIPDVGRRSEGGERGPMDRVPAPIHQLAKRSRIALPGSLDQVERRRIGPTVSGPHARPGGWTLLHSQSGAPRPHWKRTEPPQAAPST